MPTKNETKQGVIVLLDTAMEHATLYKIGTYEVLQPLFEDVQSALHDVSNGYTKHTTTHPVLIDLDAIGLSEDEQYAVQTYILNHTLSKRVYDFVYAVFKEDTDKIQEAVAVILAS